MVPRYESCESSPVSVRTSLSTLVVVLEKPSSCRMLARRKRLLTLYVPMRMAMAGLLETVRVQRASWGADPGSDAKPSRDQVHHVLGSGHFLLFSHARFLARLGC